MDNFNIMRQATLLSHQIATRIGTDILHEGQPIIILEGYAWVRETLSLLAKQSNLFESILLLLENNMEDEAYILVRSQFNNMVWICYLSQDENNKRVKEYFYEPMITQYIQMQHIEQYLKNLPNDIPYYENFKSLDTTKIKDIMINIENILQSERYNIKKLKTKSIFSLVKENPALLGMYISFYNDASKFEHADMSTVKKYRSQVTPDIDTNTAFILDLSRSDISKWKVVFRYSIHILFTAINELYNRIKSKDAHLFDYAMFEEIAFCEVIVNLQKVSDVIDSIQE